MFRILRQSKPILTDDASDPEAMLNIFKSSIYSSSPFEVYFIRSDR